MAETSRVAPNDDEVASPKAVACEPFSRDPSREDVTQSLAHLSSCETGLPGQTDDVSMFTELSSCQYCQPVAQSGKWYESRSPRV